MMTRTRTNLHPVIQQQQQPKAEAEPVVKEALAATVLLAREALLEVAVQEAAVAVTVAVVMVAAAALALVVALEAALEEAVAAALEAAVAAARAVDRVAAVEEEAAAGPGDRVAAVQADQTVEAPPAERVSTAVQVSFRHDGNSFAFVCGDA